MSGFFSFDTVVYDILLEYLPHSTVSKLSQVNQLTHTRVSEHTRERLYWIRKLKERGIHSVPSHVDPFRLYKGVSRTEKPSIHLIDKYLSDNVTDNQIQLLFLECLERKLVYMVELLPQDKRLDLSVHSCTILWWASRNGYTEVVRLLLQGGCVNPSADDNYAILSASYLGQTEVVRLLLQDERVDPSARDNYAIRSASEKGNAEVVRLLLQDKRVDPSAKDNDAIQRASENGHTEVVELLKQDPHV